MSAVIIAYPVKHLSLTVILCGTLTGIKSAVFNGATVVQDSNYYNQLLM
jgi:hypothetical protein